ncbi:MAG TPA: copper-binding protein [Albitalea sp.]
MTLKPRLAFVLAMAAAAAHAQTTKPADHAAHHPGAAASAAAAWTDGEVRTVDKKTGKVTLKHGPITNLDMPGMTMAFPVADPKLLDAVKSGDKVRFTAEKVGGAVTVTGLQPAK